MEYTDTFRVSVKAGETNLLRVINAAMNTDLFFSVANHTMTVVAVDALYTKPFQTNFLMLGPGQTTDVLLVADQGIGRYYMAARAYSSGQGVPFDNTTTTAILEYVGGQNSRRPILPRLPFYNDTATVTRFNSGLRSLASPEHPVDVPQKIDESLSSTVELGLLPCPPGQICGGPNGTRLTASMNNISFSLPKIALLQAAYFGINGVFTTDFPQSPPVIFDYTGQNIPRSLWAPISGTKLKVLEFNSTVQMVFQATNIFVADNHPMHVHGYSFYVVGQGFGNYNPRTDPLKFNLVDPPKRNTIGVPVNGWTAIRFRADNPGT